VTTTDQDLAEETPTGKTPTEEALTEEALTEETPTGEALTEETPTGEALTEETPTGEDPPGEAPAQETPAEETAAAAAPAEKTSLEEGATAAVVGKGRRLTRARVLGALAAMLVAAVAATAVLQWVSATRAGDALARLESERALRLEVSGAASAFSKALLSYDYTDLQTTRSTLMAQATGDFLATYDAAFGGPMAEVIVKLKATSLATVREVYLADVDEASAHAIVVVDQQVNTSEAIRSVKDSHLKITLVKQKGVWKIQDVTVLGAASEDQYTLDDGSAKKKD
jgi:hypothetical protein